MSNPINDIYNRIDDLYTYVNVLNRNNISLSREVYNLRNSINRNSNSNPYYGYNRYNYNYNDYNLNNPNNTFYSNPERLSERVRYLNDMIQRIRNLEIIIIKIIM